ncbi:MAG: MFS transporter [Rhodovarius sp.]|nr:MFS transporter [Rhodovarius sp.]MDW8314929.1 MFS transporter [Rhodovarius sp.]
MPPPTALAPLRHPIFRLLWLANLASNIGLWVQNTGAGWLMTTLDPSPLMVSLVQAASMLPVFLLALPAGALADILERRLFLLLVQGWLAAVAIPLALLDAGGLLGPWGLIALTFALGAGLAASFPGWAATTAELVPREDLVGAIALNGIGFNIARAVGPALGGLIIASLGTAAAFAFNALCIAALALALLAWRRRTPKPALPAESFLSAMRAGLRFVSAAPAIRNAILRACVFFLFGAAVWGLMPLLVRQGLGLGPQAFGLILGTMGAGAVAAGFIMPYLRPLTDRSGMVLGASLLSCLALALIGLAVPSGIGWPLAVIGIFLFGMCWLAGASTLQTAASLAAPGWVRARALGIYQMCFFGAMTVGAVASGWLGERIGVSGALVAFALLGAAAAVAVRGRSLDAEAEMPPLPQAPILSPKPEAPELRALLEAGSGRVLEVVRYTVAAEDRAAFLAHMEKVRRARLRAGALIWRLYENVAEPERFVELWLVESWTEHLREAGRMTETDRALIAAALAFDRSPTGAEAARYVNLL